MQSADPGPAGPNSAEYGLEQLQFVMAEMKLGSYI